MYRNTQSGAFYKMRAKKNSFKSIDLPATDGVPIGTYNVPQGSVVVAGGSWITVGGELSIRNSSDFRPISSGFKYTSTFLLKTILFFGQQTRRFMGVM
jgi:hypothetical protein